MSGIVWDMDRFRKSHLLRFAGRYVQSGQLCVHSIDGRKKESKLQLDLTRTLSRPQEDL